MQQLERGMEEIEKVHVRWRGEQNKKKNFKEKKVQSELLKNVDDDEHRYFHCNADPKKTAAILNQQHQMIETIKWKKIRGMTDQEQCRLCNKFKEIV